MLLSCRRKGVLSVVGQCAVIGALAAGLASAATIGATAAAPTSVPAGTATTVTVTSAITDPSLIPGTVILQQLTASGQVVAVLGTLHDDGVNGDTTASDGTYTLQTTVYQPNPSVLTFRVAAGFKGALLLSYSPHLTVNITGTGTGITILTPANLLYTNTSPINVTGTVGDPAATVKINGVNAPVTAGQFLATLPLVEGLNTLTAVATNTSGITTTASVQVTLDTTPPHLTIDSPQSGGTTSAASITVSGTANDVVVGTVNAANIQVTVNGIVAQVANRYYSAANVPLAVGPNTIQAVGRDQAGNGTTVTATITRILPSAPPAPKIGATLISNSLSIVSGNNQTATIGTSLASPLVVSLTNSASVPVANQPVVFTVTGDNGMVTAGGITAQSVVVNTGANGQAQVAWTLGKRSGAGIDVVQASSTLAVSPVTFTATGTPASASQIVVDSGNNQTGALNQALVFPLGAVVTDSGHNRVPNVPVTFTVTQGGGNLNGTVTQLVNTDSNGRALAVLTLGSQPGNDNNVVQASFSGNPGLPVAFSASALTPGNPANTTITGVVLDNSNNPLQGVTMRLFLTNQASNNNLPMQIGTPVETDVHGNFLIAPAPVGYYKLMADGTTALSTNSYPTLEYDIVTVAGQNNTVGTPIYLPVLDTVHELCVSPTTGGTLTLPQSPGFALTVAAGSATFPGGSKTGCVTVTTVHGDKVPMAPGFGQQPRFIVSIQPVGTIFNPPAPITIPNVDGLKPRAVTEMYSYDHDLSMFVAIGTGTVSNDGSVIATNPGVGVLKAGWHCGGDPNTAGTVADCPTCQICNGTSCVADPAQEGNACSTASVPAGVCVSGNCQPVTVQVLVNNTAATSDDITALNGAQPLPVTIKMTSGPSTPISIAVQIGSTGRGTVSPGSVSLANGQSATVTITPTSVSAAANDGQITATYSGTTVGQGNFTVVNITLPAQINASNTPTGMPNRIPPTVNTSFQVQIQPDLTGSGQTVTLARNGNSASNGDFSINGGNTFDIVTTGAVQLSGTVQTAATGGTGGGNAGNLQLVGQVRGTNAVQSSGFSVAAIPVNFSTAKSGDINDGTSVGLQVTNSWTSDSGNLADLSAVQRSEQIDVVTATGVFSGTGGQTSGFFSATLGSLTDSHSTPDAVLTGNGSRIANQAFIFNDQRTGVQNAVCPNSGFVITRTATLNADGSVTFTTHKAGQATTSNGYTTTAGSGVADSIAFKLVGGVVQP